MECSAVRVHAVDGLHPEACAGKLRCLVAHHYRFTHVVTPAKCKKGKINRGDWENMGRK